MNYAINEDYCFEEYNKYLPDGIQYSIVTDLATEPVDVDFFKLHARIDFDTDDELVDAYVKSARQHLEMWSQLSFGVKTMGLQAFSLPKQYKLMFGKVNTILTSGFTNVGDYLIEGGKDINITYTTLNTMVEPSKIPICRYAAGLYINRENIIETKFSGDQLMDAAKEMLKPYRNVSLW